MITELVSIALPIGNTEDLSFRARKYLENADGVLAEDTRKFKDFIRYAGISSRAEVVGLPAFEEKTTDFVEFFKKLSGKAWALVTDAGTPSVSDPGAWALKAAHLQGIKVRALPGPSALTLALQLTGGFGLPIAFLGFPPKKNKHEFFAQNSAARTLVFFESKHGLIECLTTLAASEFRDRQLFILRELTKEQEEVSKGNAAEHLAVFAARIKADLPIGELTFVLEGLAQGAVNLAPCDPAELVKFRQASPSQAAKFLAKLTGITREAAYELLSNPGTAD